MSGNVAFLLLAVVGSIVGSVVYWLRTRKPTGVGSSIDSFAREMKALAPERPIVAQPEPGAGFRALGDQELAVRPAEPTTAWDAAGADAGPGAGGRSHEREER